jgi:hypothetical protein
MHHTSDRIAKCRLIARSVCIQLKYQNHPQLVPKLLAVQEKILTQKVIWINTQISGSNRSGQVNSRHQPGSGNGQQSANGK